ncbi:hypothetical protein VPHK460_0071 [Vibrio phage K460]
MTLQSIDHITDGLSKFTSRLDHEELKTFVSIFLKRYQNIEDSLLVLSNQKSIDLAEGVWLDYIGKLLNIPRGNLNDTAYRLELRKRIVSNNADGTPNKVIQLVKDFTSSVAVANPSVMYRQQNKAYAVLIVNSQSNIGKDLYNLVEEIKPAGVDLKLMSDFNDNAFYFIYESEKPAGENFQVTKDGATFDNFQVTFDGVNFEDFRVFDQPEEFYEPSVKGEQNTFYYEQGSGFQVTKDGGVYEDLHTNNGSGENKAFKVVTPYNNNYVPSNIRPWLWEVQENSIDYRLETLTTNDSSYDILSLDYITTSLNLVEVISLENRMITLNNNNPRYDILSNEYLNNSTDLV